MHPARSKTLVRFGTYEVSFESGELRKAGIRIKIQQQPLKVLELLLERPGEVVTRDELRSRIWPNEGFGDFDQALNIAMGKLRVALGDSAENPRFIETLPKRGYRFLADVTVVGPTWPEVAPSPIVAAAETRALTPLWARSAGVIGLVFLLLAVGTALAIWLVRTQSHRATSVHSLVVLPLENFSGDPAQEYFADGMTDELITDLAQVSALRVISRTSAMNYKGARKPLPQVAKELNVDVVVEGSVRRIGDRVVITAQLIQAPDDKHLWAASYEGNVADSLTLQKSVARAIVENIQVAVTPKERQALQRHDTVNPEAYKAYLKGRFFWNKRTGEGLKIALEYFQEAIDDDPKYAAAYSGLADTYALLGDWEYAVLTPKEALPKAKAAALKAVELEDSLGEAHASLGFCLDGFDWDLTAGDREFKRAVQLSPGYATAHHWYAWHLMLLGKSADALEEMRKAESLDPLSLIINSDMAELLLIAGHSEESVQQSRKTLELDPNFPLAHNQLGLAYLEEGKLPEAIAELQDAVRLSGGSQACVANLARAYALANRRKDAIDRLDDLKQRAPRPPAPEIAVVYAALGDHPQAIAWLDKAYEDRLNPGVLLRTGFNPLHGEPKFQSLRASLGLPH